MYIFKQAKLAMLDFDKYQELLKTKLSKAIFYALFFIIIFNVIFSSIPFISYYVKTKGFDSFVEKYVPDFTVENSKVVFDEYSKVETPLGITFIYDDKENNAITEEDKKDVDDIILKVTPTYIISSTLNINVQLAPILETFNINEKADLANIKLLINIANIFAFLLLLVSFSAMDIGSLLVFTVLVSLSCKIYNLKLTFKDILKLTIYVNTMPYILSFVFSLLSFPMPLLIYVGMVIAYLTFILKNMSNNNKNKTQSN